MFFPFNNFRKIPVSTSTQDQLLFTTQSNSLVWFLPNSGNDCDDGDVGVYIEGHWIDSDGVVHRTYVYSEFNDLAVNPWRGNSPYFGQTYTWVPVFCPAGLNIRSHLSAAGSDTVSGDLFILELPGEP